MNFKIGQKVVCVVNHWEETIDRKILWFKIGNKKVNSNHKSPKKGDILTISKIKEDNGYLYFKEFNSNDRWQPEGFRPLDYEFVEEVIKNLKEEPVET